MTGKSRTGLGRRVGALVVVAVVVGSLAWSFALAASDGRFPLDLTPADLGVALAFSVVGPFLLWRGAVLNIAVLLCVMGVGGAITVLDTEITTSAINATGTLPGASLWVAWLGNLLWLPGVIALTPLLLIFPDGRLTRRGWHWPIRIAVAAGIVFALAAVSIKQAVTDNVSETSAPNPTGFIPSSGLGNLLVTVIGNLIVPTLGLCLLSAVVQVFIRRRRADGVGRSRLTALLIGGGITGTLLVASAAISDSTWWAWVISLFGVSPIAASIGLAVLRYRLYDIDRIVSRTVAYAGVLIILGGIYITVLITVAAIVPTDYGQIGVAIATLLVTLTAVPLTRRVRNLVDRRFNRRRYNAERTATAFATQLRHRPDHHDVPTDLLAVITRTVQPAHAAIWLVPTRVIEDAP